MVDQIAVVTKEVSATGTVDFTDASITETFTAAILIFSGTNSDGSDVAHGILGIGFVAPDAGAATQEEAACAHFQNGQNTTPNTGTRQSIDECVTVGNPTVNDAATATVIGVYSASIAGGVRLNFTTVSVTVKVTAVLFAGLTRAYTDDTTGTGHEDVGGTTDFQPDLVIAIPSNGTLNTNNSNGSIGIGFALNKAGIPQVSCYVDTVDATEPTDSDGYVHSTKFVSSLTAARALRTQTLDSFDATGFNHTQSGLGTNCHYLALKFSGAFRMACANLAVSGSTGPQAFNDFGFTPDLVFGFSTLLGALDTLTDGATAACGGVFVTGRYGSRAITVHHEEGITPAGAVVANAHTRQEDVAVLTYNHTGTVAQRATWVGGSGSGGFVLDFSTATAGFLTALGIQLIPSPPLPLRRIRKARRARLRRVRRPFLVAGRPIGPPPITRLLQAVARIRRKMRARLFQRRIPIITVTPPVAIVLEEPPKGRIAQPGLVRGRIVGASVREAEADS